MNYVIIGNGPSAISAMRAIREVDLRSKLTVVSDEPYLNYSRPLISYLLSKKIEKDKMLFCQENFYKENQVQLILDKKAKRLDIKKKEIILSNKERIPFDRLLIATGGTPIVPEVKDRDLFGVFTFTKLQDAEEIARYIRYNKVKEAVIVGGGLIGLKAAEALIELKIKVTIVELADRILSATFDKKASSIIESALEKIGGKLLTNNTVVEIKSKDKKASEVILRDKKRIRAELVILAIGVRAEIELVKGTSIKTNKGILVGNFMQTNIKDIYAAGDCCEAKDSLLGISRPIAIWPVATGQGKVAGYNMAGVKKEYSGSFTMNSMELCGIPTISVGQTYPERKGYEVLEHFDKDKPMYKKIVLRDNRIVGAIFVGEIERAGIYTGLIRDRVDTGSFKEYLLKEDFGLIILPKEYRKHLVTGAGIEV
jgi:NAD(P)H-nitrite reductase large subunit